jgi:hypothetical protein
VTLGTAGISAHLTVVRLPTAHDVFAKLRQYRCRRQRHRRMLGRVVDCGHRGVGPGEFIIWMTSDRCNISGRVREIRAGCFWLESRLGLNEAAIAAGS